MTEEAKAEAAPGKIHKIASAAVSVVSPVVSFAGKLPVIKQVKTAIAGSARTWEIAAFWLICMIAAYVWGHQEEAKKYTAVFSRLSACVAETRTIRVPACAPAPAVETAPAPAAVAPALPPLAPPASPPHKRKRAAGGAWWQF